uniref:Uncharacterized protein n=1 Tax=Solanum lycopersicum TaxID=4081 RepID=A0A3Q7GQV6_SOLLC
MFLDLKLGINFGFRAELVTIGYITISVQGRTSYDWLHHQFMNGIRYVNICKNMLQQPSLILDGQGRNPKVSVNARVEDKNLKGVILP